VSKSVPISKPCIVLIGEQMEVVGIAWLAVAYKENGLVSQALEQLPVSLSHGV
jgi:hypothetical protein